MICTVLRPFPGPGESRYLAGEEVDVSEWKHVDKLIAQRYLRLKSLGRKKVVDPLVSAAEESKTNLDPSIMRKLKKKLV